MGKGGGESSDCSCSLPPLPSVQGLQHNLQDMCAGSDLIEREKSRRNTSLKPINSSKKDLLLSCWSLLGWRGKERRWCEERGKEERAPRDLPTLSTLSATSVQVTRAGREVVSSSRAPS